MQITIPFNDWSMKRLRGYRKRATSRNKRYGNVGLAFVRDHFYHEEGCDSEDEFIAIWNEIHPRKKFDDEHKVWLHLFKEIEDCNSS